MKKIVLSISLSLIAALSLQAQNKEKALSLFSQKNYAAALTEFEGIKVSSEKDRENLEYHKALCRIHLNPSSDGQLSTDEFLKNFPASTYKLDVLQNLADVLYDKGDYQKALHYYKEVDKFALSNQGPREDFVYKKGACYYALGDYTNARPLMYSILDSKQFGADATYSFAHMCYQDNDLGLAQQYFEKVKDLPKYKQKVPFYLANIYFADKKYEQAIACAKSIIDTADDEKSIIPMKKIVGKSYFSLGDYNSAIPYLKSSISPQGASVEDLYELGYAYYNIQSYPSAIEYFNKIVNQSSSIAQSAYYLLGNSYLKTDKKTEALNAFRAAANMDYDRDTKQEAWYNYASLSYEIGNPYQSVPEVLSQYLKLYPQGARTERIYDYLLDSYISSKEYKAAIDNITSLSLSSVKAQENLQKAAFYYANQLLNASELDGALKYYKIASESTVDPLITAKAYFWMGETLIRMSDHKQAKEAFAKFSAHPQRSQTSEYDLLNYQLGYLAAEDDDFKTAKKYFTAYSKTDLNATQKADVTIRIADCDFALGNYQSALAEYSKVADTDAPRSSYALYQKSVCYSVLGRYKDQVNTLNSLIERHKDSSMLPQVYFDLGVAYTALSDTPKAVESYLTIEKKYSSSPLVPDALAKAALAYYNSGDPDKALALYKKVVESYPSSSVTASAMRSAREIFVEKGDSEDFIAWSRSTSSTPLDNVAIDSLMFETAQKAFVKGEYSSAISGADKYLAKYPSGLFSADARYYRAESFAKSKDTLSAAQAYKSVMDSPSNKFTEGSMVKYIELLWASKRLPEAIPVAERLYSEASVIQNQKYALVALLAAYKQEEDTENIIKYSKIIISSTPKTDQLYQDASTGLYAALVEEDRLDEARKMTPDLLKESSGENAAKSLYYSALIDYRDGKYEPSIEQIARLTLEYPSYKFWAAKALVLMAQNFYAQKDLYQADYILQNVIDNFSAYPEVINEAKAVKEFIASQSQDKQ